MSTDSKPISPSAEHMSDNPLSTSQQLNHGNSPTTDRSHSLHSTHTYASTPPPQQIDDLPAERPLSPKVRHRAVQEPTSKPARQQRIRSNSPRKTFSYLSPDRLNIRQWKENRRQIAKQEENNRIYYENRQKLERLAKVAKEPSLYPIVHVEQERLRERHAVDYRRQIVKNYLPILRDNLCLVSRLANVKGVYDIKRMNEDFARHTQVLKQDAANRQKARETAVQQPFSLPKINLKS